MYMVYIDFYTSIYLLLSSLGTYQRQRVSHKPIHLGGLALRPLTLPAAVDLRHA